MTAMERQEEILEILCTERQVQIATLVERLGASERTIRRDLECLACSYPVETMRGRYGGGIKIADWYHRDRKTLNKKQAALLMKLAPTLVGEDLEIMNSIINTFAPY